jgi:4-oxalocrotonate tautomerase
LKSRHARERGHPVTPDVSAELNRRGVLDHPLSRMMTSVQDALPAACRTAVLWKNKGESTMPEITVNMAVGRTDEQKAGMMRDITQALVKNLGVDAEAVVIQINEAPLTHKMKGGQLFVDRFAKK